MLNSNSAAQMCANCGAPKAAGLCTNVTCQNHNGPSAAQDRDWKATALMLEEAVEEAYEYLQVGMVGAAKNVLSDMLHPDEAT